MSKSSDRRPLFDTLETRQLLSAAASNVVTVNFNGQSVQALCQSYVIQTKNDAAFLKAAAKAGYSNVSSLGGSGFYSFTSATPFAKLQSWARSHSGGVESLSPNVLSKADALPTTPLTNDPLIGDQYWIQNTGQTIPNSAVVSDNSGDPYQVGTPGADINLAKAWQISTGAATGIVVAVMDTGLDVTQPDIIQNLWTNPNISNGVDSDGDIYSGDLHGWNTVAGDGTLTDAVGHGTACAGIIGATGNNSVGVSGVNQRTQIMAIKADTDSIDPTSGLLTGGFLDSDLIKGINYIVTKRNEGVNIVALNLSLGGQGILADNVMTAAFGRLSAAGIVVVAAAANDGANNDNILYQPQRQASLAPNVLTVAATDNQDNLASFSNYGAVTVAVGAPGVQIMTIASSSATQGTLFDGQTVKGEVGSNTFDLTYFEGDGTSFAAPIVTGIIALAKSVYPQATAAQLVSAVKAGVDQIASLNGTDTNGVKRVSTGGRVDAYNTLRILQNRLAGTNAVTQGNWYGSFGTNGNFVYGATTGSPSLAYATSSLIPTGASVVTYAKNIKSTDPRLPTNSAGTARATGYLYSPTSLSFGFNFGTTTQRLSLYAASVDKPNRTETVSVYDATTGLLLQSVSLSNFASGKYVSFDLTGAVTVSITTTGNAGVVLNGLFLDLTPTVNSASIGTDTTTQGNWQNTYGDLGYVLPGVASSVPSFINFGTNATTVLGRSSGALSPVTVFSSSTRSNGTLTTAVGSSFDIAVNVTDGTTRKVSFYLLNPTSKATATRVQEINPNTAVVTASQDVSLAKSGEYVTFTISGSTTFRFNSLIAGVAPAVAGVFFGSYFVPSAASATSNSAAFVDSDTTSQGNWLGTYGQLDSANSGAAGVLTNQYYIAGAALSALTPVFSGSYVTTLLSGSTLKRSALQDPAGLTTSSRIIGTVSTQTSFSASVDTGSPVPTTLSAYFVDYKNEGLAERVDIVDNTTGAVLSTQVLRNFQNGKYLTWSVTGSVSIVVTRLVGPEAVLSAIFTN
jgi:subtilisin family serine protease